MSNCFGIHHILEFACQYDMIISHFIWLKYHTTTTKNNNYNIFKTWHLFSVKNPLEVNIQCNIEKLIRMIMVWWQDDCGEFCWTDDNWRNCETERCVQCSVHTFQRLDCFYFILNQLQWICHCNCKKKY